MNWALGPAQQASTAWGEQAWPLACLRPSSSKLVYEKTVSLCRKNAACKLYSLSRPLPAPGLVARHCGAERNRWFQNAQEGQWQQGYERQRQRQGRAERQEVTTVSSAVLEMGRRTRRERETSFAITGTPVCCLSFGHSQVRSGYFTLPVILVFKPWIRTLPWIQGFFEKKKIVVKKYFWETCEDSCFSPEQKVHDPSYSDALKTSMFSETSDSDFTQLAYSVKWNKVS